MLFLIKTFRKYNVNYDNKNKIFIEFYGYLLCVVFD